MVFDFPLKYSNYQEKLWKLQIIVSSLDFFFSVICFSETWFDDLDNSAYGLPDCISRHQVRSDCRGSGVSIYIHSSLKFKERPDLSIISKDIETLTQEILSDKTGNILVNVFYRPPVGQYEQFENFLTIFFSWTKNCNKDIHITGDFNLNLLDHDTNKKV